MFKECGRRRKTDDDDGRQRTDNGACLYYKLTYVPKSSGELKRQKQNKFLPSDPVFISCASGFVGLRHRRSTK